MYDPMTLCLNATIESMSLTISKICSRVVSTFLDQELYNKFLQQMNFYLFIKKSIDIVWSSHVTMLGN